MHARMHGDRMSAGSCSCRPPLALTPAVADGSSHATQPIAWPTSCMHPSPRRADMLRTATHPGVLDVLELQNLLLHNLPQVSQRDDLLCPVQAVDEGQAAANLMMMHTKKSDEASGAGRGTEPARWRVGLPCMEVPLPASPCRPRPTLQLGPRPSPPPRTAALNAAAAVATTRS